MCQQGGWQVNRGVSSRSGGHAAMDSRGTVGWIRFRVHVGCFAFAGATERVSRCISVNPEELHAEDASLFLHEVEGVATSARRTGLQNTNAPLGPVHEARLGSLARLLLWRGCASVPVPRTGLAPVLTGRGQRAIQVQPDKSLLHWNLLHYRIVGRASARLQPAANS